MCSTLHFLSNNDEKYNKFPQSARKANHLQRIPPAAKLYYFLELTKHHKTFHTFCIPSSERKRLQIFTACDKCSGVSISGTARRDLPKTKHVEVKGREFGAKRQRSTLKVADFAKNTATFSQNKGGFGKKQRCFGKSLCGSLPTWGEVAPKQVMVCHARQCGHHM